MDIFLHCTNSWCDYGDIREVEISYVRVRVQRDRETFLCQLKISVRTAMPGVGHSKMYYMPVHTKVCVNMRRTRNRTPQNRCGVEIDFI